MVLEVLLTGLDIVFGPWSVVGFEEGRNARAAMQVACGHGDRVLALQYRHFCGGCTAEALLGAPVFWVLGPSVWAWKLVPLAFHAVTMAAGGVLVGRTGKSGAVWRWGAWMVASPLAYRELVLTGWGNHVESGAFALGSVALMLAALDARRWGVRWLGCVAAGVWLGLGLWFCRTSAWALVPMGALGLWAGRRGGMLWLLGLPAGLWPLWHYYESRPEAWAGERARLGALVLAEPSALWAWVVGDLGPARLWPSVSPGVDGLGALWVGLAVVLGVWGLRRQRWVALGALGMGLAWALRADLWAQVPGLTDFSPFDWRYRAPMWPLLAVGLAAGLGRVKMRIIAVLMVGFGLSWRVSQWELEPNPGGVVAAYGVDGTPDPTVPEGVPPVRQLLRQGRRVDLERAVSWVEGHDDALDECHQHHIVEQGRRAGLGVRDGERPDVVAWWAGLSLGDRMMAQRGLAWAIAPPGGTVDLGARTVMEGLTGADLAVDLAAAPGGARVGEDDVQCAIVAMRAVDAATGGGRWWPVDGPPAAPEDCKGEPAWTAGLVRGVDRWLGCGVAAWPGTEECRSR